MQRGTNQLEQACQHCDRPTPLQTRAVRCHAVSFHLLHFRQIACPLSPQAVFNHQRTSCPGTSPNESRFSLLLVGSGAAAPMLDLQGMQVAWQDEESDVLLLRVDSGIPAGAWGLGLVVAQRMGVVGPGAGSRALTFSLLPLRTCAEYGAGALGWDAGSWAAADTEVVTISHPRGDLKKLSRSTSGLRRAAYASVGGQPSSGETHYRVRIAGGWSTCSLMPFYQVAMHHAAVLCLSSTTSYLLTRYSALSS